MKPNQITAILMGLGVLFFVFYDFLALTFAGSDATISVVINQWAFATDPLFVFMSGTLAGGLAVHFLKWAPKASQV